MNPKRKSPFNPAGSSCKVYKDAILDCKATGTGLVDDTKAIQDCISAQNRCGGNSDVFIDIRYAPGHIFSDRHILNKLKYRDVLPDDTYW